jgi:hypothetical protein
MLCARSIQDQSRIGPAEVPSIVNLYQKLRLFKKYLKNSKNTYNYQGNILGCSLSFFSYLKVVLIIKIVL